TFIPIVNAMFAANKYYVIILFVHLLPRCASIANHTGHPGDYIFLVAGGQRIPEIQNYTRYMVSLRSRTVTRYFGDNHYCAGIIISPLWILTSAQCAVHASKIPRRPRSIIVVAGTENRIEKSPTTSLIAVDRVISNPNFTLYGSNDIALLRLKTKIQLNARTQIMPLPNTPPPYGSRCVVLGWGRIYYKGPLAAMVSHVELILYTEDECKRSHPHFAAGDLCAGDNVNFDHDPCRGDAGGPLIYVEVFG
ncbi:PREDICTED: anionic trypsin-2-like, partial [Rhagoletis zephyria]|uniref:anionic trypsin-2-like n=1 Tax=Rhagoletis zephyria TaxID=28612 RepID=UPI0008115C60